MKDVGLPLLISLLRDSFGGIMVKLPKLRAHRVHHQLSLINVSEIIIFWSFFNVETKFLMKLLHLRSVGKKTDYSSAPSELHVVLSQLFSAEDVQFMY